MIYDKERHVPVKDIKWDKEKAKQIIKEIFDETSAKFHSKNFWPSDENEDPAITANKSFYFGASGNLWALDKMSKFLGTEISFDKYKAMEDIHNAYLDAPDTKEVVPSLFLGEVGILLVKYKLSPSEQIQDKLYSLIESNIENITLETLWGAPGTMLGALYMYEWTKEERWSVLFNQNAKFLISMLKDFISKGEPIWTQDMYDRQVKYVGAGHGYFGNMFPMIKGLDLLAAEDKEFLLNNIIQTTIDLSIEENGKVNWPPTLSSERVKLPLVQWCHGAPGIINSLRPFPIGHSEKVEELLSKAGELVWSVGPLNKGIGLCHGTDGNGYSFLQLYKRSGDQFWLDRARTFAMNAIEQRNGKFSVFTGELGLGQYLMACIEETDEFPLLDFL